MTERSSGAADRRDAAEGPTDDELAVAPRGRVRRAPRYAPFVVTGVLAGVLVAVVLVLVLPPVEELSSRAALGWLSLVLGLVGGLVGAAVAVVLDRRRR